MLNRGLNCMNLSMSLSWGVPTVKRCCQNGSFGCVSVDWLVCLIQHQTLALGHLITCVGSFVRCFTLWDRKATFLVYPGPSPSFAPIHVERHFHVCVHCVHHVPWHPPPKRDARQSDYLEVLSTMDSSGKLARFQSSPSSSDGCGMVNSMGTVRTDHSDLYSKTGLVRQQIRASKRMILCERWWWKKYEVWWV